MIQKGIMWTCVNQVVSWVSGIPSRDAETPPPINLKVQGIYIFQNIPTRGSLRIQYTPPLNIRYFANIIYVGSILHLVQFSTYNGGVMILQLLGCLDRETQFLVLTQLVCHWWRWQWQRHSQRHIRRHTQRQILRQRQNPGQISQPHLLTQQVCHSYVTVVHCMSIVWISR